jgi:O-methyltransferase domain
MFDGVPGGGDVYVMKSVLHDWDDAAAATVLRRIHNAAPAQARLVVLETVIGDGSEQAGVKWLDLLMLVLNRGRERAEPEWRALLESTGFEPTRIEDGLIEARCR